MGGAGNEGVSERLAMMFWGSAFARAGGVLGSPMRRCPACGSDRMDTVIRELDEKVRCAECGRCWKSSAGGISLADPLGCRGCVHRATCFEHLREGFAGWWSLPGLDPVEV